MGTKSPTTMDSTHHELIRAAMKNDSRWVHCFFDDNVPPNFQDRWVRELEKNRRTFHFKKSRFVKPLNKPPREHSMQVWEMRMDKRHFAVKLVSGPPTYVDQSFLPDYVCV